MLCPGCFALPTFHLAAAEQRGHKGVLKEAGLVMQGSAGTRVMAVTVSRDQGAGVHHTWAAKKMPFGDDSLLSGQNNWVAGCSLLRGRKLQVP